MSVTYLNEIWINTETRKIQAMGREWNSEIRFQML